MSMAGWGHVIVRLQLSSARSCGLHAIHLLVFRSCQKHKSALLSCADGAGDVWYPQPAPKDHPWRTMPNQVQHK